MNKANFIKLVNETIEETEFLLSGSLKGDSFLKAVNEFLMECRNNNFQVATKDLQKIRLMGLGAVKQFDSFDFVPEAEKFISLAIELSKLFETN